LRLVDINLNDKERYTGGCGYSEERDRQAAQVYYKKE
jgi:hypothetical protein